jgi:iron complex outermembrane receptor protein
VINSANAQLFPVLQALSPTPITPQTNFYNGAFDATQWTGNIDIDNSFAIGLAAPLNVAIGGELRRETFEITQGEPSSYFGAGAQSFDGYTPLDQSSFHRTSEGVYIDFATDPIKNLHVDLAGRYEHYSDFGDTEVGKVTVRYDFNPMIAIRGTISTGFRAPTLAEEFYSSTNVAPNFALVQLPPNSAAAASAGFAPLKPEKSNNYSVGVVLHPIDRMQVTVDAYEIDIRDRIINSGTLLGTECDSVLANGACAPGHLTVVSSGVNQAIANHGNTLDTGLSYTGIEVFSNAANTRTRGVEATVTYASDFGDFGHVNWSAGFNYNETTVTALRPLPAAVTNAAQGQTVLLGPTALEGLTTATPREKVVLSAYWTHGPWAVNLRETIYGPASQHASTDGTGNSYAGNPATLLRSPLTSITDLDIGYKINSSLKLDVGANNLFDKKAPVVPYLANLGKMADGNNVYKEPIQFSPYGINGGYYYAKVTFDF